MTSHSFRLDPGEYRAVRGQECLLTRFCSFCIPQESSWKDGYVTPRDTEDSNKASITLYILELLKLGDFYRGRRSECYIAELELYSKVRFKNLLNNLPPNSCVLFRRVQIPVKDQKYSLQAIWEIRTQRQNVTALFAPPPLCAEGTLEAIRGGGVATSATCCPCPRMIDCYCWQD